MNCSFLALSTRKWIWIFY